MRICRLPTCRKPFIGGYGSFCCRTHGGQYSALRKWDKIEESPKQEFPKRAPNGSPNPKKKYKDFTAEQKGKYSAYVVERQRKKNCSMPLWANKQAIQNLYIQARTLSETTGILHEVDHIIPLNHPLVCGLHVESNLQILTESENQYKSNIFNIE